MQKIKLHKDTEITAKVVEYILDKHESERERILKLKKYYKAKNPSIMNRVYKDSSKPQNKLPHGYASYITNMATGYFLGSPISYKSDKNKPLLEKITEIFKYNDEEDHNTTLGVEASICGYAVELNYIDSDTNIRFKHVPNEDMIIVFDDTLEENINFVARYYNCDKSNSKGEVEEVTYIEVYTKDYVYYFKKENGEVLINTDIEFIHSDTKEVSVGQVQHYFLDVPCTVYKNNNEMMGDFERVLALIDAYDKSESDSANDFEYFTQAILAIYGELDEEDIQEFKDARILNFSTSDSKAEYIIKNIQDAALENYKNRIDNDIHKFSNIPNMSDESFANNASGVALGFKLMGIENLTKIKESKFKKGLQRRIELICNILKTVPSNDNLMEYLDIVPVFTRTKPINMKEEAETLSLMMNSMSTESAYSKSPLVEDATAEIERRKHEYSEMYLDNYPDLGGEDDENDSKLLDKNREGKAK